MPKHRLAIAGCLLIALVLVVVIGLPARRQYAEKMVFDSLVTRPLNSVRNNDSRVSIMDRRLLHELAADRKCVENLTELTFSSVTLQDRDEAALKQLHNLATIGFYCCENVDSLMPSLAELQVNVLCFEMTDIAPESLSTIGTANVIGEIVFEQNLTEGQVRALQAFPATIKVTSSFPLDAYD